MISKLTPEEIPEHGWKNGNLWFIELYFYLEYIPNKNYTWQGKTLSGVLLEERKLKISK